MMINLLVNNTNFFPFYAKIFIVCIEIKRTNDRPIFRFPLYIYKLFFSTLKNNILRYIIYSISNL